MGEFNGGLTVPKLAFNAPVSFWKLTADDQGAIRSIQQDGNWSLGKAIDLVIHEPADQQWRFSAVSGGMALDHITMRRLADTSIFKAWVRLSARNSDKSMH
jgi:hypothetical protein